MKHLMARVPDLLLLGGFGVALTGIHTLLGEGWTLLLGGLALSVSGFVLDLQWGSRGR